MSYLFSMLTLLVTTFIALCLNFNCWNNFYRVRDRKFFLFETLWLSDFFYKQAFIETITIVCLVICGFFLLLVV